MKRLFLFFFASIFIGTSLYLLLTTNATTFVASRVTQSIISVSQSTKVPEPTQLPRQKVLQQSHFVSQTFNNCGPASLSMVLSMYGTNVPQGELAAKMRPFNNPAGGVDDKSIFAPEFVTYAKQYGYESLHRPNGTIELLKQFVANDIPVVVRTWLNDYEDIGHFRIVRGYDEEAQTLLQDDSYQGPNLMYGYDEFLKLWQPFNYGYILVYPKEKQEIVDQILGEEKEENTAWQNTLERAEDEQQLYCQRDETQNNEKCGYAEFNIASAYFYLGDAQKTVEHYEKAVSYLPTRMLWYQTEPIEAYLKTQNYDRVFSLTENILSNGNLAYSELYQMRGEAFMAMGNTDAARTEFEKAVYYNSNFQKAKDSLDQL